MGLPSSRDGASHADAAAKAAGSVDGRGTPDVRVLAAERRSLGGPGRMTPSSSDLIYVAVVAIAWPLYDQFVEWPWFMRSLRKGRRDARLHEYWLTILKEWAFVVLGVVLWVQAGRRWSDLQLSTPTGWRLWGSVAAAALLAASYVSAVKKVVRSPRARSRMRLTLASVESILPRSKVEFAWFVALAITAGIGEEFVFRGYIVWTLAPWLGWWGAAGAATASFALLHAYQGKKGIPRTGIFGAVMTLTVAGTHSLLPAMALHAVVDVGSGIVGWLALKDPSEVAGASVAA